MFINSKKTIFQNKKQAIYGKCLNKSQGIYASYYDVFTHFLFIVALKINNINMEDD